MLMQSEYVNRTVYELLYPWGMFRGTVTWWPWPTWVAPFCADVDVPVVRVDVADESPISESDIPKMDFRRLECECEYVLDPRFRTAANANDCKLGT